MTREPEDIIPQGMVTSAEKVAAHVRVTRSGEGAGARLDLAFIDYYEHSDGRRDGHIHFTDGTSAHFGDLLDLAATLGYPLRQAARRAPAR
jgi:hypothetical protein